MRAWIMSDLHIDSGDVAAFSPHPEVDVIIMAGDLCDGDHDPLPWLLSTFTNSERERMIFVPGNHEAYGLGIQALPAFLRRLRDEAGIVTLSRQTAEIGGKRFVGCTQWSDLAQFAEVGVGDLVHIPDFSGAMWRSIHADERAWLEQTVRAGDIVVTHHAPSYEGLAVDMQHELRLLAQSSAYYADFHQLIARANPALWVHGHTHVTRRYSVAGVPIATNGRGRGSAHGYVEDFVVDLP